MIATLRTRTRHAHTQLEKRLNLLDETLDIIRYRDILQRFYAFWRVWEPLIGSLIDDEAFLRPRRRLLLLRDDLAALGLSPDTAPGCAAPALRNGAEALGSMYVMEGSTLGGRVIQKNVARRLGLSATSGCRYFFGYGEDTARMWAAFLQRLDITPRGNAADVVKGALATFASLEASLAETEGACGQV